MATSLDCTVVIKTFNRPPVLQTLLCSIREKYPTISIIVVDDSDDNYKEKNTIHCNDYNAMHIKTEFDIGLAEGRNIGVRKVKTKYTHIFDDDSILKENQRLEKLQEILELTGFDLVSTDIHNGERRFNYCHNFKNINVDNTGDYKKYYLECVLGCLEKNKIKSIEKYNVYKCDVVLNNFMANTEKLVSCPWIPELKLEEHIPFFADWYLKGYSVCYCPDMVMHAQIYNKKGYRNFRKRRFLRENEVNIKYIED